MLLKRVSFLALMCCFYAASAQTHADGFVAMQLKQWDKAVSIYTALVKADPADQPAQLNLGSAYLSLGDKDKAKAAYDAAFNAKPEGAYAFVANGRNMLLQNNGAEADKQFAKAAKSGKKDVVALRQIAESYLYAPPGVKPNFTRSEELLKAALDVSSKDINTIMTLGYCYKEMPNGGLAAQQYELAESLETKNPFIKFMLAKVYKTAKLPEKAVVLLDKAIALNPKYTLALRYLAELYYFDRKWEKALEAYTNLVNNGDSVIIEDEMQLANCQFVNKKYPDCIKTVEKIMAKDRSKTYLVRLLAYCAYETGDYVKCLSTMQQYFKEAPADKVLWSDYKYLGQSMVKTKGDTLAGIESLKKAIVLDTAAGTETWKLNQDIAKLYYNKRDYCSSLKHHTIYLDSIPKPQATELYDYGIVTYYCKDDSTRFAKAEQIFVRITEMAPKAGIGWLWAAKSAAKLDPDVEAHPELIPEFGKAEKYWIKYIEIAAVDANKNKKDLIIAYQYLAYKYYKVNDTAKAKEYIDKAIPLDPTNQGLLDFKIVIEGGTPATPAVTPATPDKGNGGGGKQ